MTDDDRIYENHFFITVYYLISLKIIEHLGPFCNGRQAAMSNPTDFEELAKRSETDIPSFILQKSKACKEIGHPEAYHMISHVCNVM